MEVLSSNFAYLSILVLNLFIFASALSSCLFSTPVLINKVGTLLISFLGLALGASSKDLTVWNLMIENAEVASGMAKQALVKRAERKC